MRTDNQIRRGDPFLAGPPCKDSKKRRAAFIGLLLLTAVLFTGCGTLKENNDDAGKGSASGNIRETYLSPAIPLLEEIRLGTTDPEKNEWSVYELASGEMIYGTASRTYVEKIDGSGETQELSSQLSAMDIAPGDDSGLLLTGEILQPDYALIDYEYSDCSEEVVYTGSLEPESTDLEQYMITFAWFLEDGEWKALDYSSDEIENHEDIVTLIFAVQGPAGNFGAESGQICGIFAEYYGN